VIHESDIVVVGGGLVGALTTLAIAQLGREVTLLDRSAPSRQRGVLGVDIRNVAMSPGSMELLEQVGVWSRLNVAPYNAMQVWEERGTAAMEFLADDVNRQELGWIAESSDVLCTLWDALSDMSNVTLEIGAPVEQVRACESSVVVETSRGEVRGRLLVAADGGRSQVRRALRVAVDETPTGHHALATVVRTERGHGGVAFQCFLNDEPLALLPSVDAKLSSVVWSQSPEQAERRASMSEQEFCQDMQSCLQARLGAVQAVDQRLVFPLTQMLVHNFSPLPRVLLIGDAARVVHPLAGLGANIGFEDVRDLLDDLGAMAAQQDPGAPGLWRKFARQRRARSQIMLSLMTGLRKAYARSDPLSQWLRNSGVGWLNQTGLLKRQLVREALGLGPIARRW
jgi:2-octaprenylphenol hydroxylase